MQDMGGYYRYRYNYDRQNRLVHNDGSFDNKGHSENLLSLSRYSPSGRIWETQRDEAPPSKYYYDANMMQPHAVRLLNQDGNMTGFTWDRNGNMQCVSSSYGRDSYHLYDENNNMLTAVNNRAIGYYAYDSKQQRIYKLTGVNVFEQINAGEQNSLSYFDDFG